MNLIARVLSTITSPKKKFGEVEIRFYMDANPFGEHGTINVSHVKHGLVETDVAFVFAGITTPPKLDLETFVKIWHAALRQGYVPHHIKTYGREADIVDCRPKEPLATVHEFEAPAFLRRSSLTLRAVGDVPRGVMSKQLGEQ